MDVSAATTAQRWPGAPTSPLVAAWPIELPHLQFQIHGSLDGVAAVHLLKVSPAHPPSSPSDIQLVSFLGLLLSPSNTDDDTQGP